MRKYLMLALGLAIVMPATVVRADDYPNHAVRIIIIADMPDTAAAAAVSLTVGASGAASCTTSELLTVAQVDDIANRRIDYRPPGA